MRDDSERFTDTVSPDAELFRGRTLEDVLQRRPRARGYFTFADRHWLSRHRQIRTAHGSD